MDAKDLESVPLFAGLSKKERQHVAGYADVVDLPIGYHLCDQGAFAHEFFESPANKGTDSRSFASTLRLRRPRPSSVARLRRGDDATEPRDARC